jgi:hypothetical protein
MAALTVFSCTSGSVTMFTWYELVVAGILAGTCGYSGNYVSPSTAAIFWANQDLLCAMYSAEFSMVNCFRQNLVKTSKVFFTISSWKLSYFKAFQTQASCFLLHVFLECIAKYDPSNKIQLSGYLVDLFKVIGKAS